MRLVSFNVNGIRAAAKKGLTDSIRMMNPDIIGFQETKATEEQVKEVFFGFDGYHVFAHQADKAGYSGTAILSKTEPIQVVRDMGIAEHDREGRVIMAEFEHFFVVNVYVPNSQNELARLPYRKQWDADLAKYLNDLQAKKPVIFMGDLNVAHRDIDLAHPKANYNKSAGYTQDEIDGLDRYLSLGLVDTFRELYPTTVKYSWWSFRMNARAKNVGWRIDYVLMSKALKPKLKEAFILNEVDGSDHCPVGVDIVV